MLVPKTLDSLNELLLLLCYLGCAHFYSNENIAIITTENHNISKNTNLHVSVLNFIVPVGDWCKVLII